MKIWSQAPLVRLLLPFLTGIITAVFIPFHFQNALFVVEGLALIISAIVLIPKLNISYKKSGWFGLLVNITLFACAYQLTILKTEKFDADHFSKFINDNSFVYVKVAKPYLEKEKSLKIIVEILAVSNKDNWEKTSGKTMLYIKKDARALGLNYGDELILKANFKEVPPPQNPSEFNYKRFLAFHNVYQQAFVNDNNWIYTGKNSGNILIKKSIQTRNYLLNILTANKIVGDEFAVAAALLLGYEDRLDADIISAYASTGALHVLSVSGLHVAIVYFIFSWFLFFFDKIKHGKIIKAIILILFLWFYAALTGLSPSVLRAATMFSFIVIAKAFNRHTNIYNTLAASAFLLLIINPYIIMEVGFQLSYLAVIGIVYIQPKIYERLEINNYLLDKIWAITAVSIAAQIATFPLGLLYFHQFPNYFLLSNFIVIPLSTIIMYIGIALFVFAKVSFLAGYIALIFNWFVWILNQSIKVIEHLPNALLNGISITVLETWLIYGVVILAFFYFTKRQFNYLMYTFSIVILLMCFQILEQQQQYEQKKMIIYNIPKISAIDFISANHNVLLTDSAFAKNNSSILFHIKHNWWDLGISSTKIISDTIISDKLIIKNNWAQFYDKRILIVDNQLPAKLALTAPLKIDYLIISKNPSIRISDIIKKYNASKIIFDSSNANYRIQKWKKECAALKQMYYSVPDSGAFVMDLLLIKERTYNH